MATPTITEIIPIETDKHGVIRVSKTRVTLDTIIGIFKNGATAEEIAQRYPSVPLADIYAVISYYLRRQDVVEDYLMRREKIARQARKENEARFDPTGIRERLMARMKNKTS